MSIDGPAGPVYGLIACPETPRWPYGWREMGWVDGSVDAPWSSHRRNVFADIREAMRRVEAAPPRAFVPLLSPAALRFYEAWMRLAYRQRLNRRGRR